MMLPRWVAAAKSSAVVLESLILCLRKQPDQAKLLHSHKSPFVASQFVGLQQLSGRTLASTSENVLPLADEIAMEWLSGGREDTPLVLEDIQFLFERAYIDTYVWQPESLTEHRVLETASLHPHNSFFSDGPSAAHTLHRVKMQKRLLTMLDAMKDKITPDNATSAGVLRAMLTVGIEEEKFVYHSYLIDQMRGVQISLPWFMTDLHALQTPQDAIDYVDRLERFGEVIDASAEMTREASRQGIIPPSFVLDKVSHSLGVLLANGVTGHTLLTHFRARNDAENGDKDLDARAEAAVAKSVVPSLQRLSETVAELRKISTNDAGCWKFPNGLEYYAWTLRRETGTNLLPQQIHELGLQEVDKVINAMKKVMVEELGQPADVDVIQFMRELNEKKDDRRFFYGEDQKDQCLEDFRALVAEIDRMIEPQFATRPKQPIEIRRVAAHMEEGSPQAFYMTPSLDGTRNGVFYVNVGKIEAVQKYEMRTLTAHEAIPGHHFQLALACEDTNLPYFRKVAIGFTAFIEGWGLYAEKIAGELGLYNGSPYDKLGHFGDELFRCARLVVDTGLHAMRWEREQAVKYMVAHTSLPPSDVECEIDRYCVMPGQACAYKIGQLKLLEVREKARKSPRYTDQEFHRVVLSLGSVPLQVLEDTIDSHFT